MQVFGHPASFGFLSLQDGVYSNQLFFLFQFIDTDVLYFGCLFCQFLFTFGIAVKRNPIMPVANKPIPSIALKVFFLLNAQRLQFLFFV